MVDFETANTFFTALTFVANVTSSRALVAFGGTGFPFFVLIGADNVVVARFDGEVAAPDITYATQHLAAGKSPFRSTG